MTRTPYVPPRLPASLARRDLHAEPTFDVAETRLTAEAAPAYPTEPRLISSAHGPIRHVLLWYASYAQADFAYRAIYRDLLASLPAATEVTVVAHPDVAADLRELVEDVGRTAAVNVVESPPWLAFTVWAEDACVVVDDLASDPTVTYLVEPETFPRSGDAVMSDLVAQPSDLQATQVPLVFQGGNVLVGDDFVLVGRDYLDDSLGFLDRSGAVAGFPAGEDDPRREAFVRDLFPTMLDPARTFHFLESDGADRQQDRVISIGGEPWLESVTAGSGTRQPIFHIDMFVSLAGRDGDGAYRVLIGSPGIADELLGWERVDHDLQAEFDAIAAQLEGLGFAVTRTPLPYLPADEAGAFRVQTGDGRIIVVRGLRTWYYATSNNCLVQIVDGAHDVWLPTYGHGEHEALRATDDEHRRIWESLGFTVHQLGDFHPFALRMGALHCIKKYLAR